jgi:hypothetical protein
MPGRVGGLAALFFMGTGSASGAPVAATATVCRVILRRGCRRRVAGGCGAAEQVELAQAHAGWHEQWNSNQERDERSQHGFDNPRMARIGDTIN